MPTAVSGGAPGADACVVHVGCDDDSEAVAPSSAVQHNDVARVARQPRVDRLADAAQALQRRRERRGPAELVQPRAELRQVATPS